MWISTRCCSMIVLIVLGTVYFWGSNPVPGWMTSGVLARASFEVGLALPLGSSRIPQRFANRTSRTRMTDNRGLGNPRRPPISRYMLRLYHRRPDADIVRALQPARVSRPLPNGNGRILEFSVPPTISDEVLEAAELLATAGAILRVGSIDDYLWRSPQRARRDDYWRAFNVTSAVLRRSNDKVRLRVRGRIEDSHRRGEGPLLLLSYSKPKRRKTRSLEDEERGHGAPPWKVESSRRQRRNPCRKRSLYVDFATISYNEWVIAPKGYDAYQCVGKCFYPLSDHLSPTKHAIVQTLVYTALQGSMDADVNNKPVGRACCVPTRLTATSLLYMDSGGTLTYQYGYEDMVVAECGCR